MDPITAVAALGAAALSAAAAWVQVTRDRKRPALVPVRVRSRQRR